MLITEKASLHHDTRDVRFMVMFTTEDVNTKSGRRMREPHNERLANQINGMFPFCRSLKGVRFCAVFVD